MKLGYVIVYVPHVADTVAFYEKAFGLARRFVHEGGDYAEMDTGSTALAFAAEDLIDHSCPGTQRNRPNAAPAGAELGLVSADVMVAFQQAVAAGATTVMQPTQKPWGQTVAYVRDNNGFLVEICSAMGGGS